MSEKSYENKYPILVTVPHASHFVPADLRDLMILDDHHIRKQSDLYTDLIYKFDKVHTVEAGISRLVADVNRAPDNIEMQNQLYNTGVVVSVDEYGEQIYREPPSMDEIMSRVDKYHHSFHREVEELKPDVKFLLDGHSYWSHGPDMKPDAGKARKDISLGNRGYTTCSREITAKVVDFFESKGLSVAINDPYSGEYIIGYHCSRRGLPGMHIEISRHLYMDEKTLEKNEEGTKRMRLMISELLDFLNEEIVRCEKAGRGFS